VAGAEPLADDRDHPGTGVGVGGGALAGQAADHQGLDVGGVDIRSHRSRALRAAQQVAQRSHDVVVGGAPRRPTGGPGKESARAALGSPAFQAEFEARRRLGRDAAIGLALGEPAQVTATAASDPWASPLREREAEVAHLVAEGLSNKQIGVCLFISEHTVDSHIRSILNKLGVNSRAQIAVWIASAD
jgi:DNA-binding CsgD family transcriptional regulator